MPHDGTGKGTKNKRRLTPAQRSRVVELVGQGKNSTEINREGKKFKPPFEVEPSIVSYYREKLQVKFAAQKEAAERQGVSAGLAAKAERVALLERLAAVLTGDLLGADNSSAANSTLMWLKNMKTVANRPYSYKEFNAAELRELRGLIDDIAKEVGGRSPMSQQSDDTVSLSGVPADMLAANFIDLYRDVKDRKHAEYILRGGRGSTKSSAVSLMMVYLLVTNPGVHGLAMRQVASTLRDSVYNQLLWAISALNLSERFRSTISPLEVEYTPTGQKFFFRGADDPAKVKSIKPAFGYIGLLWLEELDQFHGEEAVRKIEQSVLRGGDYACTFKTFNPPRTVNNWANKYVKVPKDTQYQHVSDYRSVPPEWLGRTFLNDAEHLAKVNPSAYQHEYLGDVNGIGKAVFDNVELRRITDKEIAQFDHVMRGLDWGFYPDPAHYVVCHFSAAQHTLYIYGEVRAFKLSNRKLYDRLVSPEGGVAVLGPNDLLIADSAEPKSIADLKHYGANIRAAEKGPESVAYSIKWLQGLTKIVIDNERAPHTSNEFLSYEYEETKDGDILSEYPDKNNHGIDATRYATNMQWRRRGQ